MIVFSVTIDAQVNYVLNPSFEQYSKCPYKYDQIKFAKNWTPIDTNNYPPLDSFGNADCTPEYCNTCAGSNSATGIPTNGYFFHYPRTGNGMAQMGMFYDDSIQSPYLRDYLQGRLSASLSAGQLYCVTFFIAKEQVPKYAVNHIGAYLDDGIIDTTQNCGSPQTTHIPQVQTLKVITDTLNWVKIEGSFIATGLEKYITIGNFYNNAQTTFVVTNANSGSNTSLYLIDDVSVVESNIAAYAGGTFFKAKKDSVFIGRNEIIPDCEWYRNGVLIDTLHAGFWVKDTSNTTYVVKQSICGNVKYDSAKILIVPESVESVGNESVYRVFPNPAQREITIQAPNNTSKVSLVIYDMSGRMMMAQAVQFANGEASVPLSLSSGVYMVDLVDEEGRKNIQRLSVL